MGSAWAITVARDLLVTIPPLANGRPVGDKFWREILSHRNFVALTNPLTDDLGGKMDRLVCPLKWWHGEDGIKKMFEKCVKVIIASEARAFSWWAELGQAPSLCLRAAKRKSSPVIASPPPPVRTEDRQIGSEGNILGRDEKEGSSRARKWTFKDPNCNCECLPCV